MSETEYGQMLQALSVAGQHAATLVHAMRHASVSDRIIDNLRLALSNLERSIASDPGRVASSQTLRDQCAEILGDLNKLAATQGAIVSAAEQYLQTGDRAELEKRVREYSTERAKAAQQIARGMSM